MSGQTTFNPYSETSPGQLPHGDPPPNIPNHLAKAILSTICCCIPLGIVAIVFAAQVNGKLDVGDYAGAQKSSEQASFWGNLAIGLGAAGKILVIILYVIFVVALIAQNQRGF